MQAQRIFNVLDRLAHPSTSGEDLDQTVAGFRRLLQGKPLAEVLRSPVKHRSYDSCQEEIATLREKLKELQNEKTTADRRESRQIKALIAEITKLQSLHNSSDKPQNGFYTRIQVKQIISLMFAKDHGVCKALVEKNAEQRKADPALPKITDSLWQQWQRRDQYPEWAIGQLRLLTSDDLPKGSHKWSPEDKKFVINLWMSDPHLTNQQLADACSEKFGCRITDSSIRGVLNRAGLLRPPKLLI